ncbi:MAG: arginine--tRNA ligase [Endomicrobiales bacterium]
MIKQTIRNQIDAVLLPWLKEKGIDTPPPYSLEEPPKGIPADLASNAAMLLAKQMKTNPRKIAEELSALLSRSLSGYVTGVEIAGAGFLNLRLSDEFLYGELDRILREKDGFGQVPGRSKERVLVEFVSANPTGPLHIGHGRGAAIGDSLSRIFSFLGYTVEREYYINDVGNQMEMLGRSLEARYRELKGEQVEFPQDGYKGEYMKDIARRLIDGGKPAAEIDFKETALTEMMATIGKDLDGFGVRFDNWFSESLIAKKKDPGTGKTGVEAICEWLREKGLAFENEGALWFATTKFGDDKDRVLRRNDGRYTYLASDIAYHKNKLERGYDRLLDLWGADHHGYVARMKAAIEALGYPPEKLTIILYQLVSLLRNGVPVAMSTRAGEFVTLEEVLKEVGRDACRFFFMLRAPDSPLEFDLELAKKQSSDNPVFYVQYVHARCSSIFKEHKTRTGEERPADVNYSLLAAGEERELIKKLVSFPDTLELCLKTLSPHHLTIYLMEVADLFHRFYEKCRVLSQDRELTSARLALVEGVATIIKNGLDLLGVSAPARM